MSAAAAKSPESPSCWAFPHRVAFEEGSGPRVLLKGGPGNRGRSACGPTHVAHGQRSVVGSSSWGCKQSDTT